MRLISRGYRLKVVPLGAFMPPRSPIAEISALLHDSESSSKGNDFSNSQVYTKYEFKLSWDNINKFV